MVDIFEGGSVSCHAVNKASERVHSVFPFLSSLFQPLSSVSVLLSLSASVCLCLIKGSDPEDHLLSVWRISSQVLLPRVALHPEFYFTPQNIPTLFLLSLFPLIRLSDKEDALKDELCASSQEKEGRGP